MFRKRLAIFRSVFVKFCGLLVSVASFFVTKVVFVLGCAFAVLGCLFSAWACSSPAAAPTAYGAALDACVEASKTLAESRACRAAVVTAAGRDAGGILVESTFVRVVAFDNGHPSADASTEGGADASH